MGASEAGPSGEEPPEQIDEVPTRDVTTPLLRARRLERLLGVGEVWLKWEGANPTGTHKDRIAVASHDDAHARGADIIALATCGNFGTAVARACSLNGVRARVFMPAALAGARAADIERLGARVELVEGDYAEAVLVARREAERHGWYDASPGTEDHWEVCRQGYGRIADEIHAALGRMPDTVAMPVGNGSTLAAVWDRFVEIAARTGGKPPRMLASSARRDNPIVRAWQRRAARCEDLPAERVWENELNAALTNWHAFDGQRALDAIRTSGGRAISVGDPTLLKLAERLQLAEGVAALPASASALACLGERERGEGVHVLVVTGRQRAQQLALPLYAEACAK
ncbi:MAG: pyridoxal-phosphate dependent enzyme [Myxococcota bacterium]